MKVLIGLTALLVFSSAHIALAQQPAGVEREARDILDDSGVVAALDSIAATSAPELERALDQLSVTLSALATRIANDPELRRSAAQAAHGMVGIAQAVVEEQSRALQDVLRAVAEELAALPARDPR